MGGDEKTFASSLTEEVAERVARLDQEALPPGQPEERLPRLQHRQGAGKAAEVELKVAVPCDRNHRSLPRLLPMLGSHGTRVWA